MPPHTLKFIQVGRSPQEDPDEGQGRRRSCDERKGVWGCDIRLWTARSKCSYYVTISLKMPSHKDLWEPFKPTGADFQKLTKEYSI